MQCQGIIFKIKIWVGKGEKGRKLHKKQAVCVVAATFTQEFNVQEIL